MLAGGQGDGVGQVFQEQLEVARFFQAQRFVPITNAHFMGDYEVMGEAGLKYVEELVELGARVRVPTTRNATCVDFEHAARLHQKPELVDGERLVRRILARLGISTVDTCIGYQSIYQPRLGERVAWGDTGTVIYANSVLGARTNYEAGPAALAAAITGRTPEYGFHLDEARHPTVLVRIRAPMRDLADWGALGGLVGESYRGYTSVPWFELGELNPTSDELKHLGASLASYGSMAMFHAAGVTPEAEKQRPSASCTQAEFSEADVEGFFSRALPEGGPINLVVFTAPQLSFFELRRVADLLGGRRVHPDVQLLITTNAMVRAAAEQVGIAAAFREAGALLITGTCWYTMDPAHMRREFGWSSVVTNSAKLSNIIGAHGYEPVLRRTAECVEAAVTGHLEPRQR